MEGAWLAAHPGVKAMMDISDGLAKDVIPLVGGRPVELDPSSIPLSADALRFAAQSGREPLYHALSDGEDYELAFVVSKDTDVERFRSDWSACFEIPLSCIGRVISDDLTREGLSPIRLADGKPWVYGSGYEHRG